MLVAQQPQIAPQRKVTLPNGVVLYAEREQGAAGFVLSFYVATDQSAPAGARHLLEHFVARGHDGALDAKLESHGLFLTADTLQDGMRFEIEGSSEHASVATASLASLLKFPTVTQEQVEKEARVINEETGVREYAATLHSALYATAFGAPDLIGDPEDLAKTTPEALKSLHGSMFVGSRMVVAVVGDIDPTKVVEELTTVFSSVEPGTRLAPPARTVPPNVKPAFLPGASGSGRGVPVGSINAPETLEVLAAAVAIASDVAGAQVVYAAGAQGGLVCIVHPVSTGLDDVDRLVGSEQNRLFRLGRTGVRWWAEKTDQEPRLRARLYAHTLGYEGFFRMQDLVRRAGSVSQAGFVNALAKFQSNNCVRVGGVR